MHTQLTLCWVSSKLWSLFTFIKSSTLSCIFIIIYIFKTKSFLIYVVSPFTFKIYIVYIINVLTITKIYSSGVRLDNNQKVLCKPGSETKYFEHFFVVKETNKTNYYFRKLENILKINCAFI